MKPQTAAFLKKSSEFIMKAKDMYDDGWFDEAGRAAYLAGLHAGQALIFERTDKIIKTHNGVHDHFSAIAKDDPRFDLELKAFLGRTYKLKNIADYLTGESKVTPELAQQSIDTAERFVDCVEKLLAESA